MKDGIVIFGASSGGKKVAETFRSFDIPFQCFLDNDPAKWGTNLLGKKICPPKFLLEGDYGIVIASTHQREIENQLEQMGQMSHFMLKEDLLIPCIEKIYKDMENLAGWSVPVKNSRIRKVIIDLAEGVQLGGIETWTYAVARELVRLGVDTEIFAKKTQMPPPEDISSCFTFYDLEYFSFRENVIGLVSELIKRSPCSVIVNKHTQLLYAANLAKKIAGEENISIISVLHNDEIALYRRQKRIEDMTDVVCCVSGRIRERLMKEFCIDPGKLYYKESPVYVEGDAVFKRSYSEKDSDPIQIGYAARLTKYQKRADLFFAFIEELEERKIHYHLNIAGDGAYKEKIEQYIGIHNLGGRVSLHGRLPQDEISDFWKKQDIFVSFSDFEGSSISALEAMAQGAVPIETDVSGVREFVEDGVNGYVVPLEDVKAIAEHVECLDQHRGSLEGMGSLSRKKVIELCNPSDYARYIAMLCSIER